MKRILALAIMMAPILMLSAQDDDMYFVPKKQKKTETIVVKVPARTLSSEDSNIGSGEESEPDADFHTGKLRDVDEYNRRGSSQQSQMVARMVNDTLYITTEDGDEVAYADEKSQKAPSRYYEESYYDDDYYYATRLSRYHGIRFMDPFLWDIRFGWYDPWYDPWYGYYAPYFHYGYVSWYSWGWGWSCRPGWDLCWGHHGYYRDHLTHHHTYGNVNNRRGFSHSVADRLGSGRVGRNSFSSAGNTNPRIGSTNSRTGNRRGVTGRDTRVGTTDSDRSFNRSGNNVGRGGQPERGNRVVGNTNSTIQRGVDSGRGNNGRTPVVTERGNSSRGSSSRSADVGSSSSRGSSSRGGSFEGSSRGGGFGGSSTGSSRGGGFNGGSRGGGFSGGSRGGRR